MIEGKALMMVERIPQTHCGLIDGQPQTGRASSFPRPSTASCTFGKAAEALRPRTLESYAHDLGARLTQAGDVDMGRDDFGDSLYGYSAELIASENLVT